VYLPYAIVYRVCGFVLVRVWVGGCGCGWVGVWVCGCVGGWVCGYGCVVITSPSMQLPSHTSTSLRESEREEKEGLQEIA
jgi:hypothetical protein